MGFAPPAMGLRQRFYNLLEPPVAAAITRLIEAAGATAADVYATGGAVRDVLLGRAVRDVDLAVEGDAIEVTRRAFAGGRVTAHARFRTASFVAGGARIDVTTARRETYSVPGALPSVSPAGIQADLERRDFSVNAMALRLSGGAVLLDPCDGAADLATKRIRILHDASFRDDATRVFRAARYAARLGFEIEDLTRAAMARDLEYIARIGGERLRREFELLFEEHTGGTALEQLEALGALRVVHPALTWAPAASHALASAAGERHALGFALLASRGGRTEADEIVRRLRLKRREAEAVQGIAALRTAAPTLAREAATPSGASMVFDRHPAAAVAAFAATSDEPRATEVARRYLAEWRGVKPVLSAADLERIGIPRGPRTGQALQLLRAARLDGRAQDRGDETALALRFAKSIRDAGEAAPVEGRANGR